MNPRGPVRPISITAAAIATFAFAYCAVLLTSSMALPSSAATNSTPGGPTGSPDILVASLRKGNTNDFAIARVRGSRVVGYAGTMNSSDLGCFSGRVKSNRFLSDKGEAVVAGTGSGSSLRLERIRQQVKPNKYKWVKLQPSSVNELARLSGDSKRRMYSAIDTCAAGGVLGY